ncbi:hypothetical protein F2Q68_00038122 [Brassica cretica]|uniref:Uncharacterized protein n=1 Tax=Brassica cretica TaxID=69181 RepID=A0A8S9HEP4_BRACR|nr:hypothetical protein F2Q68_00038122 [Brassica cretica]
MVEEKTLSVLINQCKSNTWHISDGSKYSDKRPSAFRSVRTWLSYESHGDLVDNISLCVLASLVGVSVLAQNSRTVPFGHHQVKAGWL